MRWWSSVWGWGTPVPEVKPWYRRKVEFGTEEGQNRLFQNLPLWHVDYFALKSVKTQQTQEHFYFSWNCLEELRCGDRPRKRVVTRHNCLKDSPLWQGKHLITTHLLSVPCELPICPHPSSGLLKLKVPVSFPSSGWQLNLNCLSAFELHIFGALIHKNLNFFFSC